MGREMEGEGKEKGVGNDKRRGTREEVEKGKGKLNGKQRGRGRE